MSVPFAIAFTGKSWQSDGSEWESVKLTLGASEEFEAADLSHWSRDDYRDQWRAELRSITRSASKGALIVSVPNPAIGYRIWVWTMWKHDDQVRFQNRLLFGSEIARGFHPSLISDFIGDYHSHGETGDPICEWTVPLASIAAFTETQALETQH